MWITVKVSCLLFGLFFCIFNVSKTSMYAKPRCKLSAVEIFTKNNIIIL